MLHFYVVLNLRRIEGAKKSKNVILHFYVFLHLQHGPNLIGFKTGVGLESVLEELYLHQIWALCMDKFVW